MRVYLAAPYAARNDIAGLAELLAHRGHIVTSSWLDSTRAITPGHLGPTPALDHDAVKRHVLADLNEVCGSDVLIHFTAEYCQSRDLALKVDEHRLMSGGRNVEMGAALARDIPVVLVGDPENVFQRALTHVCPRFEDALDLLAEMDEDWG